MDPLELARWQFGITTVYHFLMVPLTIGLGLVVAVLQTLWVATGKDHYLRMTKFWGKLFLINFIMGVATGLVQEFQFGMAWSEYSRFVGDVFGAPLALEALIAFFLESVFLGIWILLNGVGMIGDGFKGIAGDRAEIEWFDPREVDACGPGVEPYQEIGPAATVHTATESREFADGETAEVTVLRFE